MAILSQRAAGTPCHTFTIRIEQSVYDKTVEYAKRNLQSLAFTVEQLLDKALKIDEGGATNGEPESAESCKAEVACASE